MAKNADLIT